MIDTPKIIQTTTQTTAMIHLSDLTRGDYGCTFSVPRMTWQWPGKVQR